MLETMHDNLIYNTVNSRKEETTWDFKKVGPIFKLYVGLV